MPNDANRDEALLEDFFAAARAEAPEPPATLLTRVMADADAALATRVLPPPPAAPVRHGTGGWLARLSDMLGGWGGLGGLATASAAGLWLGLSGVGGLSAGVAGLPAAIAGGASLDVMPDTFTLLSQVSEN